MAQDVRRGQAARRILHNGHLRPQLQVVLAPRAAGKGSELRRYGRIHAGSEDHAAGTPGRAYVLADGRRTYSAPRAHETSRHTAGDISGRIRRDILQRAYDESAGERRGVLGVREEPRHSVGDNELRYAEGILRGAVRLSRLRKRSRDSAARQDVRAAYELFGRAAGDAGEARKVRMGEEQDKHPKREDIQLPFGGVCGSVHGVLWERPAAYRQGLSRDRRESDA